MESRNLDPALTLVEVEFYDPLRGTELYDGIHQILMTSRANLVLTHGTEVISLPYDVVRQIIVRFKRDSNQGIQAEHSGHADDGSSPSLVGE